MKYFTTNSLGAKQSLTPEGFLVCHDVAIARTGQMLYAAHEIPSLTADNGMVRIERDEASVFSPETLASFEGKPVTDDHPEDNVTPDNWRELAVGVTQNVRRGSGLDSDLLVADLLITHKDTIQAVRDGKREVSCGYDAEYEQIEPGRGRQTNIIGNHVALVARGRCGSRCAIQDNDGVINMTKIKDKILAAFTLNDKAALTKTLDELPNDEGASQNVPGVHIHMPSLTSQPAKTEQKTSDGQPTQDEALKKLITDTVAEAFKAHGITPKTKTKDGDDDDEDEDDTTKDELLEEEEDDDKKTKDAAPALDYADVVARAEIITPGFVLPKLTKDAKADPKKTRDALCECQRRVLTEAWKTADGDRKKLLTPFLGDVKISKMTSDAVNAAFVGASEVIRFANNSKATSRTSDDGKKTIDAFSKGGIDKINQNFWANLRKPQ